MPCGSGACVIHSTLAGCVEGYAVRPYHPYRELFPPLPSALGYVGVVIPLLFLETRLLK